MRQARVDVLAAYAAVDALVPKLCNERLDCIGGGFVRRLQAALMKQPGGDRKMVEIMALVLHHDEQAVLTAVELALEAGLASKTQVLNVLHRLLDAEPIAPAPVTALQALRLVNEPKADVLRLRHAQGPHMAASRSRNWVSCQEVRHAT